MSFTKFNDMFDYKGLMIWFASNEIHAFTLQILMDASYSFSKSVPFGNVASSNQSATVAPFFIQELAGKIRIDLTLKIESPS